ncbi:MAG: hypothetical protein HYS62_01375 [Candidatus Aenigmarchaeota archaeon]|nr:hypothetical protein [Candidatus Aenigmarchaeota archaeon]
MPKGTIYFYADGRNRSGLYGYNVLGTIGTIIASDSGLTGNELLSGEKVR